MGNMILFLLIIISAGAIFFGIIYTTGTIAIHLGFPAETLKCNPPSDLNTHFLTGYITCAVISIIIFICITIRLFYEWIKELWAKS